MKAKRWLRSVAAMAMAGAMVTGAFLPAARGQSEGAAAKATVKEKKKKETLPPFPKGPLEKEFKKKLGDGFKVKYTDHYFVMYNTDEETVKGFITRIEATYASVHRFTVGCGIAIEYPKEKLPVIFCEKFEEYDHAARTLGGAPAPKEAAGLYFPGANFSLFYDIANADFIKSQVEQANALKEAAKAGGSAAERKEKSRQANWILNRIDAYQEKNNKSTVQHEVAHQLLHNFHVHGKGVQNPRWFVEGMATLFEPPPGPTGAGYNVVNQERLGSLRQADKQNAVLGLEELVKTSRTLKIDGGEAERGYAQAWGLTYYLAQKKKKELQQYIELIKKRKPREKVSEEQELKDFEKCFGKLDESFKKKWGEFLKKLPYRPPR